MTDADDDSDPLMFPRLRKLAEDRDFSIESLAPRFKRLMTEENLEPEDLQIRSDNPTKEDVERAIREAAERSRNEGE